MSLIQIILAGLGGYLLFNQDDPEENGFAYLPSDEWEALENDAAIGKLYDSRYIRSGGRVDEHWGDIVPTRFYLGREEEIRGHYLDPTKSIEHFNLHGIEFGNWMNQDDRLNFHYATMVTLSDLAKVLNVGHHKMGLRQRLQLAFGARGKGGMAAAFYQGMPRAVINLTKTHGRGTFAHEYGHAIDEHLHMLEHGKSGFTTMYSSGRQTDPEAYPKDSIEYLFERVFDILYWKEDGSPTRFYTDQGQRTSYYQSRVEVWARTFERYIEIRFEEKGIVNKWAIDPDPSQPPKDLVAKATPWIQKIVKRAFK